MGNQHDDDAANRLGLFEAGLSGLLATVGMPHEWESRDNTGNDEKRDDSLSDDAINFVKTGAPIDVLDRIRSAYGTYGLAALRSGWGSPDPEQDTLAAQLCAGLGLVDPMVWVRWGALVGNVDRFKSAPAHDTPPWLSNLILTMGAGERSAPATRTKFADLMAVAEHAGIDESAIVLLPFTFPWHSRLRADWAGITHLEGYPAQLDKYRDDVALFLHDGNAEVRLHAITIIACAEGAPEFFLADLVALSCGGHRDVRDYAAQVLRKSIPRPTSRSALLHAVRVGKAPERRYALEQLWFGAEDVERAETYELAAADRAASVRALATAWNGQNKLETTSEFAALAATAGPAPTIDWTVSEQTARVLARTVGDRIEDAITEDNAELDLRIMERTATEGTRPDWEHRRLPAVPADFAEQLGDALVADQPTATPLACVLSNYAVEKITIRACEQSGLGWMELLKTSHSLGLFADEYSTHRFSSELFDSLTRLRHIGKPLTLCGLVVALNALGLSGRQVVWGNISLLLEAPEMARGWNSSEIAPFLAANLEFILKQSRHGDRFDDYSFAATAEAISLLPWIPPTLCAELFELALGARKKFRVPAQRSLARIPALHERITAALSSTRASERAVAATWLASLGATNAVEHLRSAVESEKNDAARAAIRDALNALDPEHGRQIDRAELLVEAEQSLTKSRALPPDWLDLADAPPLRWSDGKPVDDIVLRWLLAEAIRKKEPAPGPRLLAISGEFDRADAAQIAQWLLGRWIAADTQVDRGELLAKFHSEMSTVADEFGAGWLSLLGLDGKQLDDFLPELLATVAAHHAPTGSAISSKGVLAFVSACADEKVVHPSERYIHHFYGNRNAQCKALVAMLAWVDSPAAIQAVLSIAGRFRTRSIQQEAIDQLNSLAERRGWSTDELADRTIPTAGFTSDHELPLSFGARTFTALLSDGPTLHIRSDSGRLVKSLPAAREDDDQDAVASAKYRLSTVRKEVKDVVKAQTQRLHEALCLQREWPLTDWLDQIVQHPIVGFLSQRLAWTVEFDGATHIVRPSGKARELVDVSAAALSFGDKRGTVRLAHRVTVGDASASAWRDHFVLADVKPLFDQFAAGTPQSDGRDSTDELFADFEGFLIEARTLRGELTRRGYVLGEVEDGPHVYDFLKRFPSAAITAVISCSGAPFPIDSTNVALTALSFRLGDSRSGSRMRIADVPPVLLAECILDLTVTAAKGTGFEPDWKAKIER